MRNEFFARIKRVITTLYRSESFGHSEPKGIELPSKREMMELYAQFLRPGDLCFDVGANVGNRTEIFLSLGARVICIDPQPECVKVLKRRYRNEPRVVVVEKGLAAESGDMVLSVCQSANTISTFSEKWKTGRFHDYKWESSVTVPVTTLDTLVQQFGIPAFCKIDVEGFEYQVLRGLSVPIPAISFEFTKEFRDDLQLSLNYLNSLGRAEFNYAIGESPELAVSSWVDSNIVLNQLGQIQDDELWGDVYVRYGYIAGDGREHHTASL
jgi:FkbM family methyltransferase